MAALVAEGSGRSEALYFRVAGEVAGSPIPGAFSVLGVAMIVVFVVGSGDSRNWAVQLHARRVLAQRPLNSIKTCRGNART